MCQFKTDKTKSETVWSSRFPSIQSQNCNEDQWPADIHPCDFFMKIFSVVTLSEDHRKRASAEPNFLSQVRWVKALRLLLFSKNRSAPVKQCRRVGKCV